MSKFQDILEKTKLPVFASKVKSAFAKLPKHKSKATLAERKARKGWFFVLPFVIGLIVLYIPMVIDSVAFSMTTFMQRFDQDTQIITQYIAPGYQGNGDLLHYYKEAFATSTFTQVLGSGVLNLLWEVPAIVIFALFIAVILNQKIIGRAAFRAIFFVPVILSTGLMETISASGASADAGGIDDGTGGGSAGEGLISLLDVQQLFSNMKVGTELVSFVVNLVNNVYEIVNFAGVQMLIFLAGLQSISPAIYEASRIDGASAWETFWKITFPMISPMIFVNGIYTIIDSFTRQSNVVMSFIQTIYDTPGYQNQSLATAQAWIYFLIVMIIVGIVASIASAFVFYQKRDS